MRRYRAPPALDSLSRPQSTCTNLRSRTQLDAGEEAAPVHFLSHRWHSQGNPGCAFSSAPALREASGHSWHGRRIQQAVGRKSWDTAKETRADPLPIQPAWEGSEDAWQDAIQSKGVFMSNLVLAFRHTPIEHLGWIAASLDA